MKIYVILLFSAVLAFSQSADSSAFAKIERLIRSGKHQSARTELQHLQARGQAPADIYYYRGVLALVEEDADAAIDLFKKAIEAREDDYRFYENLGDAYGLKAQQGSMFSALFVVSDMRESWQKAIELKPDIVSARTRLFSYYLVAPGIAGGDDDKALALAGEVLKLEPATGHTLKARYYVKQKDRSAAEKEYLAAQKAAPKNGNVANQLGYFYLSGKDYPKASYWFKYYRSLAPNDANAYDSSGDYYRATAHYDSALVMYETALQKNPGFQSSLYNRALCLKKLQRFAEAKQAARAYLKQFPKGRYAENAAQLAGD